MDSGRIVRDFLEDLAQAHRPRLGAAIGLAVICASLVGSSAWADLPGVLQPILSVFSALAAVGGVVLAAGEVGKARDRRLELEGADAAEVELLERGGDVGELPRHDADG